MSVSFHNSQQEITKLGNFMNCQYFSPKIQKFPGIPAGNFEVADSREFPGIPEWEFPMALESRFACIETLNNGSTQKHFYAR